MESGWVPGGQRTPGAAATAGGGRSREVGPVSASRIRHVALVARGRCRRRWRRLRRPEVWFRRSPLVYALRRRLISRRGSAEGFWQESANRWCPEVPDAYTSVADALPAADGWDLAVGFVEGLAASRRSTTGQSTDSVSALRAVMDGSGTCSDLSQVLTGVCVAAGVRVREWGVVSGDGLGHAFCEVWSDRLDRWCLIDPAHACYVIDAAGEPVGVLEVLERASGAAHHLRMVLCPGGERLADPNGWTSGRYLEPGLHAFIVARNQVFAQDPVLRALRRAPLPAAHLVLLAVGRYQRWWVYGPDDVEAIRAVAPRTDGVEPRARLPLAS